MARNKHPEVTVERVLEAARRLFMEKGYENTTIQDIVNELGGLTKGAIYHHFKSKEDIMSALGDQLFDEQNPFTAVKQRRDLNGLQKLREVIRLNQQDAQRMELNRQTLPLLKNPRWLAEMMDANRRVVSPLFRELVEEGVQDGSIRTEYAAELAELFPLLTEVWLAPSVYPASLEESLRKFSFLREMLERMGLPLIDDEIFNLIKQFYQRFYAAE